jgi:Carboxypeptidase regulatory-like domain
MFRKCALALLLLSCASLFAQDFRATLTGTVTDPSGAAVPNATVKATNTGTNIAKETQTNAEGVYTIPFLDPGVYDVEVSATGFQTLKRQAVTLSVAQRLAFPIRLTVGQASTEITVTGQVDTIETADASRGLVFDPIKTQEYPLNGRQSYMLLSLTPGVIFGQQQFGASGFSGTRGWDVNSSYKFNGARQGNGNNVFMLNGTPISDNGSQWEFAPSVDAIQEFKAETTAYDASYGHEAGGVVNTTIRSGTNNWHGDVYDYFRNRLLDANFFQNNIAGSKKGRHNQNQFGGVFGGPIRKDKDFLFASFEGWQEVVPFPGSGTTDVPMDIRDGQHFSQYNMQIFDPLTTHACGAPTEPCSGSNGSAYWRDPFPGNVIPQSRISPIGTKILSYFPAPNSPGQGTAGISNNYVNANNYGRYWYNQPIVRWDHVFGDKDKFYAMFSEFHGYEFRSSNQYPPPLAQGNLDNNRTFTGLNLDETHVISSNMVLDLRASWFRFVQLTPGYTSQAQAITAGSIGMTNMPQAPTVSNSVIPNIDIQGFTGPVFGNGSYSWSPYNRWFLTPMLSWTRGTHSFRFGGEVSYEAKGNVSPGRAYGAWTFGQALTQHATDRASTTNGGTDSYLGVASLLLGIPTAGTIDNNASYYITRPYFAGYAQDDWKVSNRLTVNVGLRYEVQIPYMERYNRMAGQFNMAEVNPLNDQLMAAWKSAQSSYDSSHPNDKYGYPDPPAAFYGVWQFAGQNGAPRRTHYTDWTTFAPRFGFAYRIGDKTVIRGGFGVYYQSDTGNNTSQTGFSQSTSYQSQFTVNGIPLPSACYNPINGMNSNQCATAPTGAYSLVNPYPLGLTPVAGPAAGALANLGQGPNGDWNHYKTPRTYQYSLGFQRQLPKNMLLDVSFAGNYALYDRDSFDQGHYTDAYGLQLQQIAMNDPSFFSTQLPNPFQGILPSTTSRGSSTTLSRSTLLNNYPLWGGFTMGDDADRYFRSDAGQLRFEKRAFADANSGLGVMTWVLSWTFSKEYAMTCCIGQSWQTVTGANLVLSPNGQTGTLQTHPQNSYDNRTYNFDSANQPQEIAFSGVWDLPIGKNRKFFNGVTGVADKISSGWRMDYILSYISGNAIGLPGYINFCGDYTHYVDPNTGQPTGQTSQHWFNNNPSCYANFPTNSINSALPQRFSGNVEYPAKPQLNLAIEKNTQFGERYKMQFRAEAFNLTNTPILGSASGPSISTSFTSATFGILPQSQSNFPRFFQLAAKLFF